MENKEPDEKLPDFIEENDADPDNVLKPKSKRNFTPEYRLMLAERMKKVNAERISKIRDKKALENVVVETAKQIAVPVPVPVAPEIKKYEKPKKTPKHPTPPKAVPVEKKKRQIKVIELSSDDDGDDISSGEESVVLVRKSSKKKSILKTPTVPVPPPPSTPVVEQRKVSYKFF